MTGQEKFKERRGKAIGSKAMRGDGVAERLSAPRPEPASVRIRY